MALRKRKRIRERGKLRLGEYFKELKKGERVAIIHEKSFPFNFPRRIIGKTAKVVKKKGTCYVIEFFDGKKKKEICIMAIHLKKLKS